MGIIRPNLQVLSGNTSSINQFGGTEKTKTYLGINASEETIVHHIYIGNEST